MARSPKPLADEDLFAATMRDVKPLRKTARVSRLAPAATGSKPTSPRVAETAPSRAASPSPAAAKPNPGIDRRTAERLRKGEMAIDRRLDLHGMTEANAHAALDRFVRQAWRDGMRMLLVITGKGSVGQGGGVLRRNLPRWLAIGDSAAHVLRIETAQPRHGGSGAYYVLLRRRREP